MKVAPQDHLLSLPLLWMEQQVTCSHNSIKRSCLNFCSFSESGNDYGRVLNVPLTFDVGDSRACHTVEIFPDDECEADLIEEFFSTIEYSSGEMPIIISRNSTNIVISDTDEPECGK